MVQSVTFQKDMDKLCKMIDDLIAYQDKVGEAYVKCVNKHGREAVEEVLTDRGIAKSWLRTLEAVGNHTTDSAVLLLDPGKATTVQALPIAEQRRLLRFGVNGISINDIKLPALRMHVNGTSPRSAKSVVPTHLRNKPKPPRKLMASSAGLHVGGRELPWDCICDALKQARVAKRLPKSVVDQIRIALRKPR